MFDAFHRRNSFHQPIMEAQNEQKPSTTEMFPLKLLRMLNEAPIEGYDSIVSWMPTSCNDEDASSGSNSRANNYEDCLMTNNIHPFRVHKPKEFEKFIMPKYFRCKKKYSYRTFSRSLNLWSGLD